MAQAVLASECTVMIVCRRHEHQAMMKSVCSFAINPFTLPNVGFQMREESVNTLGLAMKTKSAATSRKR